ncbi:MAG: hypothetical protein ACRDZ9_08570 [Acidimicrobiales bacterium]
MLLAVAVGAVLALFDLPVLGTLAGIGVFVAVLAEDIPLFVGAVVGAVLAE